MQTVGMKELKLNPSIVAKSLEEEDYVLLTKRGKPIGIATPFTDEMVGSGLKRWLAVKAFRNGDLSVGQLGLFLGYDKRQTLDFLADMNIPLADYDFDEELETIEKLGL